MDIYYFEFMHLCVYVFMCLCVFSRIYIKVFWSCLFHCLILIIFTLAVSIVNIIVIGEVELECPARPEQIPELSYKHSCVTIVKKNIFSRK